MTDAPAPQPEEDLKEQLRDAAERLRREARDELIERGHALLDKARSQREYKHMLGLAEALVRCAPNDAFARRQQAQALIELGSASVAALSLERLVDTVPQNDPEWLEAVGLLGRAYKEMAIVSPDSSTEGALQKSLAAYLRGFEMDTGKNTWHGINLAALAAFAQRHSVRLTDELDPAAIADKVLAAVERIPDSAKTAWDHATAAEALLPRKDWEAIAT